MKVALANLGGLTYAIKASLAYLDIETVLPERNNYNMHAITSGLMPVEMCFPLKIILGNYLSRIDEKADAVICYSGCDMCNLNPVNYTYKQIFNELNWYPDLYFCNVNSKKDFIYSYFNMIRKLSGKSLFRILSSIYLGLQVYEAYNYIDQVFYTIRPAFSSFTESERMYNNFQDKLLNINNNKDIQNLLRDVSSVYYEYSDYITDDILKIGLIGDTYSLTEPYTHNFVDKELGKLGVVVDKWLHHKLSPFANRSFFKKENVKIFDIKTIYHNRYGVMTHFELKKVQKYAEHSYDGMIFISPLSCNPNDALKNMLCSLEKSLNVPILTMVFDEHISNVGNTDRLEAFVDLLKRRKRNQLLNIN